MILSIALLFAIFQRKISDKFEAYLFAVITWVLYCFGITEILSLMKQINRTSLIIMWGGLLICLMILFLKNVDKKEMKTNLETWKKYIGHSYGLCFFCAFAILIIVCALRVTPYNWDSMTYHCARLFHWKQNMSVGHYATGISRQVSSPLLGAFINLHVYIIMDNGGAVLNLLQCISYLTNGVIVYFISQKLHLSKRNCILTMILFYTMPIAFVEAMTTQIDNFSAMWLLIFAYVIMDFMNLNEKILFDKATLQKVCFLSASVALGYMAKPSVGFGMLIFGIWLLIVTVIRKDRWTVLFAYIGIAALIILAILLPEWGRNLSTFHALADQETGAKQLIGSLHFKHIVVNFLKNFTFNMPCIWLYNSEKYIENFVRSIALFLKIDINNPAISENGTEYMVHLPQTYGCDTAINPIIVWLMIFGVGFVIFSWKKINPIMKRNYRGGYFISSVLSFGIFCALLRWEPFVSRYMISYLALLCPAICVVIEIVGELYKKEIINSIRGIVYFICIVEFIGMFIYSRDNLIVQVLPSTEFAFRERYNVYNDYLETADYINQTDYENIGLYLGGDSYEYPLIQMLKGERRIEHIMVENKTNKYEDHEFVPSVIFVYNRKVPEKWEIKGADYVQVKQFKDGGGLWVKKE